MGRQLQNQKKHTGCLRHTIHPASPLCTIVRRCLVSNTASAYYLPKTSIRLPLTASTKSTFCEWKGWATYYTITSPDSPPKTVRDRIWSYENPTKDYTDIKGYVSFYAGPWDCYVDGELVQPQPGDFYGGWTTSELEGTIKGDAATRWM